MLKTRKLRNLTTLVAAFCIFAMNVSAVDITAINEAPVVKDLSSRGYDLRSMTLEELPDELKERIPAEQQTSDKKPIALDTAAAERLDSFTIVNQDGSKTLYQYASQIKYIDEKTNEIKFIDTTLVATGGLFSKEAYTNKSGDIRVSLPKKIGDGVSVGNSQNTVRMMPAAAENIKAQKVEFSFQGNEQTVVQYNDAFGPDIHLQYAAVNNGLKESIFMERYDGQNAFQFELDVPGLVPNCDEGASIVFSDGETGEKIFTIEASWAMDSYTGEEEDAAHFTMDNLYRIESLGNGRYRLTMVIDQAFLESATTVYPVLIDPTVSLGSRYEINYTTLFSGTSERWVNTDYTQVGYRSGYGESLIYVKPCAMLYDHINPFRIMNASLNMVETYGVSSSYFVHCYDSNANVDHSTTNYATINGNLGKMLSYSYCTTAGNYSFDIINALSKWYRAYLGESGGKDCGNGVVLKVDSTGQPYKQFLCSGNNLWIQIDYVEDTIVQTGTYYIRNVSTGNYIYVEGGEPFSGCRIIDYGLTSYPGHKWEVVYQGNGFYKIYTKLGSQYQYCLDISSDNLDIWENLPELGDEYFMFRIISNNDGTYRIMNTRGPNYNKALGVSGGYVSQWNYYAYMSQKWVLEKV